MKLTILPDNIEIEVALGSNLQEAIFQAGINLAKSCGGRGTCGKCKVNLQKGRLQSATGIVTTGEVLTCTSTIIEDIVVEIPQDGRRMGSHKVLINEVELSNPYELQPIFEKICISLEAPSLASNTDDLARVVTELRRITGYQNINFSLAVMRALPKVLRSSAWQVTIGLSHGMEGPSAISIEAGDTTEKAFGLAIDIGTTTIKVNLVDTKTGQIVEAIGTYNPQQQFGDDVINRIIHSEENPESLQQMQTCVVKGINQLVQDMLSRHNICFKDIGAAVVAGNTTMIHLFLGIPANSIRTEPYVPVASAPAVIVAREVGLVMHPEGKVYCLPAVGSYVGGDITSGVLATQLHKAEHLCLLIDIGTNGEIVLGNRDWQMSCAASAGPCFEGGGIKFGMRAMDGAIDKVVIDAQGNVTVTTVGNSKPLGLCGSGLIDTIATFLQHSVINRSGQFNKQNCHPRLRQGEDGWEFVLVWQQDSALDSDIVILETDIENIIRAKAAIFAGIRSLVKQMGMDIEDIDEILIAGGFGNSLNIRDAIILGLLPDASLDKYRYVGNSSIKGAQMTLTSRQAMQEVYEFSRGMTYLELSIGNDFMEEYVSACFLPHTDLTLFPSTEE